MLLVDDHELVRRGLRELIEDEPDIEVVAEAATAADAAAAIDAHRPDIAVLDVRLPDGNGVDVCRAARDRDPALRCLILTSYAGDDPLFDAILAGAAGYVLKDAPGAEIVDAIRTLATGRSLLDPSVTDRVLERLRAKPPEDPIGCLTAQERRVLDLVAEGMTNREISQRLYLAEQTVKNYVSTILGKLGLERRTQAAILARTPR